MKNAEKILLYLLKHPKKDLHVRGLERELSIAAQIISRNFKQLEKQGLILTKVIGKQKFAYFSFSQKAKSLGAYLLEKEKEESKPELQPIISRLEQINVKIIILFGSSLKNLAKANDIDILFVDDRLEAKVLDRQTTKLSMALPKPVVPLLLETKDAATQYDKPAIQEALAGIVVKGFEKYIKMLGALR